MIWHINSKKMNFYAIPGLKEMENRSPYKMSESQQMRYAMEIIKTTCIYFNVYYEDICKKDRHRDIVTICQISCWLIRKKMPTMPLVNIASLFGERYNGKLGHDHSAILHNKNKLQDLYETDDQIKSDVDALLKLI